MGKNGGGDSGKATKRGRGQHVATTTNRRRVDGSNCLRRDRQRNGRHNHLFDFRLVRSQRLHGYRARTDRRHTSKARISGEAACFEGVGRLCWADIRFIPSQTCWSVGVLVTDVGYSGNRAPGSSIIPGSAFEYSSHKITSYRSVQTPT